MAEDEEFITLIDEGIITFGRKLFPSAWDAALIEGLISEEEYLDAFLDHVRKENERTVPAIAGSHQAYKGARRQ